MTASTRAALITEIGTNLADNTIGAITAALARTTCTDFINSWASLSDNNTFTARSIYALTPTYDEATNTLGTGIIMTLDAASHVVAANKQFNHLAIRQESGGFNQFTIGAAAIVEGVAIFQEALSGSDATGTLYGLVSSAQNDGPATVKAIHISAAATGTSAGVTIVGSFGVTPVATSNTGSVAVDAVLVSATGVHDIASAVSIRSTGDRLLYGIGNTIAAVPIGTSFLDIWMATASSAGARAIKVRNNAGTEIGWVHQDASASFVGLNVGPASVAADRLVTINANTGATATPTLNLHIIGADTTPAGVYIDSFGATPNIIFRRATGTRASPTHVVNGQALFAFGIIGYGTTGYGAGSRVINQAIATEDWTDTAQGGGLTILTTPTGGVLTTTAMYITPSGGINVGTGAGILTDNGVGIVMAGGAIKSTSPTGGIGYATGAGGTITQGAGSGKATAVTLNTATGAITLNNASLGAGTIVTFVLNNSAVAATDLISTAHESAGTLGSYTINGRATGSGTAAIDVRNNTAGALSEAIVIRFAVIKSVSA